MLWSQRVTVARDGGVPARVDDAGDDVIVGDDGPAGIPDDSRAGAFAGLENSAARVVALRDDGGDVDDGWACGAKKFDRRFFVGGKIASRCDEARLGGDLSAIEDFAIGEEPREQAENHHERDEQLGCA